MKKRTEGSNFDTSNRYLEAFTFIMLFGTMLGVCMRAEGRFTTWNEHRTIQALLETVHAQQHRYYLASRAYSSSFETLGILLPSWCRGRLYAGRIGARATYVAELCTRAKCWMVDPRGEIMAQSPNEASPQLNFIETPERPGTGDPDGETSDDSMLVAWRIDEEGGASAPDKTATAGEGPRAKAPDTMVVVPSASPEAFGLQANVRLPPLSPTRDTEALWGPIKEEKR